LRTNSYLVGALHRKFARFSAFKDAVDIFSGGFEQLKCIWPVRGEATVHRVVAKRIDVWQPVTPRQ
jgi:hypothetical protein